MTPLDLASKKRTEKSAPTRRPGTALFLIGGIGTALLMMLDRQLGFGVPLGVVLMGVCVWGALSRLGFLGIPA